MKYMHNPITGEVKHTTPLDAKRLSRYGWKYTTKAVWVEYHRAIVQRALQKAGITKHRSH